MKLPLDDLGGMAKAIFVGHDRPIDFGLLGVERPDGSRDKYGFVVMAGLGLDARMIANTRPELKKRVGWLAYLDSLLRSVRDADGFEFKYRLSVSKTECRGFESLHSCHRLNGERESKGRKRI
ncbi:diacylglycerol/lipid kinase family protein [Curtobacterium sp. B18]|uniref:diacylglycerol/lipid kinase family protein n=1 Tax=Curtobacterium sp. B18 TaxID=95614 RepID=UPI0003472AB6